MGGARADMELSQRAAAGSTSCKSQLAMTGRGAVGLSQSQPTHDMERDLIGAREHNASCASFPSSSLPLSTASSFAELHLGKLHTCARLWLCRFGPRGLDEATTAAPAG